MHGDAYLWLCISKIKREGIGTLILESIIDEISRKYKRAYVKLEVGNLAAYKQLSKFGFKQYHQESGIVYFERFF